MYVRRSELSRLENDIKAFLLRNFLVALSFIPYFFMDKMWFDSNLHAVIFNLTWCPTSILDFSRAYN